MVFLLSLSAALATSTHTAWTLVALGGPCPIEEGLAYVAPVHPQPPGALEAAGALLCESWMLAVESPHGWPTEAGVPLAEEALLLLDAGPLRLAEGDELFLRGFGAWLAIRDSEIRPPLRKAVRDDSLELWGIEALMLLADHESCGCGCISTVRYSGPASSTSP